MSTYYRYFNVGTAIFREELLVRKQTPAGVRLDNGKFVLTTARKRYACPTDAEARESFIARKQRQLRFLKSQTEAVEQILARPDPFTNETACELFEGELFV